MRLALAIALVAWAAQLSSDPLLVFTRVTIVDVEAGRLLPERTVVVEGSQIIAIDASSSVKVPSGAKVVDARGKYLIPGLWDMHVHTLRSPIEGYLPLFIANGVTSVRDMGTNIKNLQLLKRWREETRLGARVAPRVLASGPVLGAARPENALPAATDAEVRATVRTLQESGADFVKVYSLLPAKPFFAAMDEAKRRGLDVVGHVPASVTAAQASDAGQKSMEHLYGILESCSANEPQLRQEIDAAAAGPDTWAAWGAVVRTTDRLYARQATDDSYSREKCAALFTRFVRNGTWHCPTLVLRRAFTLRQDPEFTNDPRLRYLPRAEVAAWDAQAESDTRNRDLSAPELEYRRIRLEKETQLVGEMHRAGVGILAGTDLGNPYVYPGFSLHDELGLLVKAGLSPLEALRTATLNPARFLKRADSLGSVATGKTADLVLLEGDPLRDIANTRRIAAVVVAGRLLLRADLDAVLQSAVGR